MKTNVKTRFEEIVDVGKIATTEEGKNILDIIALANNENLKPAAADVKKTLLLIIDPQNDFMEGIGSLAVPGSKGDIERLTKFIYQKMDTITQIMCSTDTHSLAQIFHPCWWIDKDGNNPPPTTIITSADVENGTWTPVFSPVNSIKYLKGLEEGNKKKLMIWPYHCLEQTNGAKIESQLANMIYFHSSARKTKSVFIRKGDRPLTEMYGIIKAEFDPGNGAFLNIAVLNAIDRFDEILIAGEAKSHCLLESVKQILEHYEDRLEITKKITVLEDGTSSIPGFEDETELFFENSKKQYGIQIKKTTELLKA